jgi:hypothetical protein
MKRTLIFFMIISLIPVYCCKSSRSGNNLTASLRNDSGDAYYIDLKMGDDNNPGTIRKPLKTLNELNKRIKKKVSGIYFAGGQIFDGTLLLNDIIGTKKAPVIISSWGDGRAAINGNNKEAIRVENCQNLWINNLNIKGNGRKGGNISNGLSIVRSSNCLVEQLSAEGFQKSGLELFDCKDIQVKKVMAVNNGFCGINIMGSNTGLSGKILIQGCKAENNPGDPTILDNHSGNGILVGVSDSVTIDHCTATNNGWDMPRQGNGPVGIWAWQSNHVTIQYCISYRNKTSKNAKDGGGFDLDGGVTNSVIQYCLSYENQGAGYGLFQYPGASDWSNNVIRYCISINDAMTTEGAGSFFIWNGSAESNQLTNCMIYNNFVYNSATPVISYENASAHKNFSFCNNIFLGSGQLINGHTEGSSFAGNVWWSALGNIEFMEYGNLAEWAKATGQEMFKGKLVGMQTDPMLRGPFITSIADPYKLNSLEGYKLKSESPLRNRGVSVKSLFNIKEQVTDFYSNPVPLGDGPEPGINEVE